MSTNNDKYTFTPSSVDKMVIGKFYTVGSGENERVSDFEYKNDITEEIKKRDSTIPDNIKYYDLHFKRGVVTVSDAPDGGPDGDDVIKEAIPKDGGRRRSYRKITVRKSRKSISRNNNKSHRLRNSRKRRYSRRR